MEKIDQQLVTEVEETGSTLLRVLAAFSEQQLNTVPFAGSWTGGQVAEHLIKSGGVARTIYGKVAPAGRQPDEKVGPIKGVFLDLTTKLQSPDFIVPSEGPHSKRDVMDPLADIWEGLGKAVGELDLTQECQDFELPVMGKLTRLEWIWFYVAHTQRHSHQLKNIFSRLKEG